ncbi:hypothetical protein D3C85_1110640 [compost metagenome]
MGAQYLPQHTIDTEADDQGPLEGLDMDVGRLFLDRLAQHGVDEADDGGVVVGVQQILALGQLFGQGEEVHLVAEILHQLARLGGVALVMGRQQRLELVMTKLLHHEGAPHHPTHLQQGLRRHPLATEQHRGTLALGQDHPEVAGEGKRQFRQGGRQLAAIELVGGHQGLLCTKGCPCTWVLAPVAVDCCWAFIRSICCCTSGDIITS